MAKRENILRKVRNLTAKAESTDNQAEAEAFLLKAAELSAHHMIDQSELTEPAETTQASFGFYCPTDLQTPVSGLSGSLAQKFQCFALSRLKYSAVYITVFGPAENVDLYKHLLTHLASEMQRAAYASQARNLHDFGLGWGATVFTRIDQTLKQVEYETMALIPTNDKAKKAAEKATGREFESEAIETEISADVLRGQMYGNQADLGQTKLESQP